MTRTKTRLTHSAARILRASAVVAIALLAASSAGAATIFTDDFESYADTAALNTVWPVGLGNDTMTFLDAGPAGSGNTSKTVHTTNRQGRRDRTFAAPFTPTATEPLVVSYDLYDAGAGGNEYNQVLAFSGATLTQLISIGKSSLGDQGDPNNPNKYQGRVAFPGATAGGVNWFALNTDRSMGWHNFMVEIFPTTVNFYVDGVLDTANVPRPAGVGDPFSVVRIGAGQSSLAEVAYYDNFSVTTGIVPEPGTVTMLAMGGLFGLATIWRKRRAA
jgi:hypothetical protein